MTHRSIVLITITASLLLPSTGCINEVLDVGSIPGAGDGSAGEDDATGSGDRGESGEPTSGDATSGDATSGGSEGTATSETGEDPFPDCAPPVGQVATHDLPFTHEDAFLGNRRIYDCTVSTIALPTVSMDCAPGGEPPVVLELMLEGLDAVPFEIDQPLVLDEVLNSGPPHGYIGAGQWFSLRDADSGELVLVGIDAAALSDGSGQFDPMPFEPELHFSVDGELCPVEDEMDCSLDERVAVVVASDQGSVSVIDGQQVQELGWEIHVAEAVDVNEPCIDAEHGRYRALLVRTP